jgi:hypothetical protein
MPNLPKPTALKLVTGNPGKRPLPENEPMPDGALLKPKWLKGRGARIWNENCGKFFWLTEADSHKFAVWCGIYAEIEADLSHVNTARVAQWRVLGSELGLDPCARAKMATPGKKNRDEADKYLA